MPAEVHVKEKRSISKPILYSLLGLFIILGAGGYYLLNNWKPFLKHKLQKAVVKGSGGLYNIQFSDIDVNLFSGHINIKDFELRPDTAIYNKFIALKKAPDNLYRVKIKELDIRDVTATKALFQKKLNIDSVLISNPELTVISKSEPYNDTVKNGKPKTLYQIIKKIFKQVQVNGISLKNGNFVLVNKNSREVKHTALNNINIDVKEVLIDSLSEKDTSRFYSSKNMVFRVRNYKLATSDSLYYLSVKDVYFSSRKRQVIFNHIAFTPRYNKVAFYHKVKFSKDRYDLKFNTVSIDHIDLKKVFEQQQLFSTTANISNANIEVYNNNAYPQDKSEKHQWDNFPHQQLQKAATAVKIDTLNLKNINVTYAEADRDTKQTGFIYFYHTSGQIFNVTNDSLAKIHNKYAIARLHTRLLNAANLNVNFKFDLTDKKGAFGYDANLGMLNGELFNKTTIALGRVKIKTVAIQRLTFNANADNYHATGQLKLYYKNLKIELLKKKKDEKKLQGKRIISALANMFILKTDNPDKNNDFRTGQIKYNRPIKAQFFYFIWQSLFTGIKSSVGLSAKKDTVTAIATPAAKATKTNMVNKIGSFLGISKGKREKRQERRQQKKVAAKQ